MTYLIISFIVMVIVVATTSLLATSNKWICLINLILVLPMIGYTLALSSGTSIPCIPGINVTKGLVTYISHYVNVDEEQVHLFIRDDNEVKTCYIPWVEGGKTIERRMRKLFEDNQPFYLDFSNEENRLDITPVDHEPPKVLD